MNKEQFWAIIDDVHNKSAGNMDTKCSLLAGKLSTLSKDDVVSFSNIFDQQNLAAYSWPLWGAAYILNGGCSDDSFADFRSSLISMGSNIFSNALADPQSLAEVTYYENDCCYEGFQYCVNDVLEDKCGELPKSEYPLPQAPTGEEWDEDDLDDLFPKLKMLGVDDHPEEKQNRPWWKFW